MSTQAEEVPAWNAWNSSSRENQIDPRSERHSQIILGWLDAFGRRDLNILEAGCGAGWMSARMRPYGKVTGVDLADEVLERAGKRWPEATFIAGDFFDIDLPRGAFDAIVSLEVLSHVPDQQAYIARIADLLKPGGQMLMATQNRKVLELNRLPEPKGWLRRWVDPKELADMVSPHMTIVDLTTIDPTAKDGPLRYFAAGKVKRVMNALSGGAYERKLERDGWGWSIMCRAQKPA